MSASVGLWSGPGEAALVVHSRLPKDLRTAAFAVFECRLSSGSAFATAKATGAPLAIDIFDEDWQLFRIGESELHPLKRGRIQQLGAYLQKNASALNPDAVYRAKTWGRSDPSVRQLDFVDAGLLPIVETELGDRLGKLLEESVKDLAGSLGWINLTDSRPDERKAEWLIQAPFWLLAAKTLRDKRVDRFKRIDLTNFEDVFGRLAKHYRSDGTGAIQVPKNRLKALTAVADRIDRFASLELLSAEALGHVYESTLINKATRKKLGTHSTPPWMIDYILGKLRPWIKEMPAAERFVFEPACGHAGFLVAALRLLDELRPDDFPEPRNTYLRKRLHGVDVDTFSQEIARLALTLADVPNPNGWDLVNADMFASDIIERETRKANIVLLNPPFESFGSDAQAGWLKNKAAETLSRIVYNLPAGGVIGFVGPQGILQSKQAKDLRRTLLENYEISEVLLFADKVFQYGEPESTVIIARKLKKGGRKTPKSISFLRVREGDVAKFSKTQHSTLVETVTASCLLSDANSPLFVPDLLDTWACFQTKEFRPLADFALVGKGMEHKGAGDPSLPLNRPRESKEKFAGSVLGFSRWTQSQATHELPSIAYLNLNPLTILNPRYGTEIGTSQVLLNYARVSRGPWRLKALVDEMGHPVTSRFVVLRPTQTEYSLPVLWALLNSPIANAFAYCHLSKRDNLVGSLRKFSVPRLTGDQARELEMTAKNYLGAAKRWSEAKSNANDDDEMPLFSSTARKSNKAAVPTKEDLYILHLRVDAKVMSLYGLPPEMERKLLDLFSGEDRKGIPFKQVGYFPEGLEGLNTVAELLTVIADWEPKAARKSELILKKATRTASAENLAELSELKRLSAARRDLLAPPPIAEVRQMYNDLVRRVKSTDKE